MVCYFLKRVVLLLPLLELLAMAGTVVPVSSVTLAWSPTTDPNVVGYRVYQGVASQSYTNMIDVGNATTITISNLVAGTTYYFAVTSYTADDLESAFSGEITYTPGLPVRPRLILALDSAGQATIGGTGPAGHKYDVLTSRDLRNWVVVANITADSNGWLEYSDPSAQAIKKFYLLRQTSP